MKIARAPHSWRLSAKKAIALQKRMCGLVCHAAPRREFRLVAGLDSAFSKDEGRCIAGVVLWDIQEQRVVEQHTAVRKLTFPYIPGLLSFREVPAWVAALRKLRQTADLLMCDGHGICHPRRFGIACHVGVLCGIPSIGCGKSRLIGIHEEPGTERGARVPLTQKGEILGTVLRTQKGIRPVYVSVGHLMDLQTAEEMVLRCAVRYRLPEPTRLADQWVAIAKRTMTGG